MVVAGDVGVEVTEEVVVGTEVVVEDTEVVVEDTEVVVEDTGEVVVDMEVAEAATVETVAAVVVTRAVEGMGEDRVVVVDTEGVAAVTEVVATRTVGKCLIHKKTILIKYLKAIAKLSF